MGQGFPGSQDQAGNVSMYTFTENHGVHFDHRHWKTNKNSTVNWPYKLDFRPELVPGVLINAH